MAARAAAAASGAQMGGDGEGTRTGTEKEKEKGNGKGESPPDRPGWTAAWSEKHQAWYWWNNLMQTTWDDPGKGEPRIVPSRLVKQPAEGVASTGPSVTQQQVDALPHVHSQLGDLNVLSMKALRKCCITRELATRGRRVDLVCRLIARDVAQAASSSGTAWQTTGHARLGQRVCCKRAEPSPRPPNPADADAGAPASPGADAAPSAESSADPTAEPRADAAPSPESSADPTANATAEPTANKAAEPTANASDDPTANKTAEPTANATDDPTAESTDDPTAESTDDPTAESTHTSVTMRGAVTAWKPADGDDAMQFYVVLHDGSEEVMSDADVEAAAAAYNTAFGKQKDGKGGRARHGERARAREGLEDFRLGKWSEVEITKLDKALEDVQDPNDWHTLSTHVGTRSHLQVYDFVRRRQEAERKRLEKQEKAALEVVVQRYMTDHSLTEFNAASVGITATHTPEPVMDWLSSAYGKDMAPSLAARIRKHFYGPDKNEAATPGQAEAHEDAEDSTEDAGDAALGSSKRGRTTSKGLPWTAAEERHLEQLMKEEEQSTAKLWEDRARALGTQRSGNSVHQRWKLIQLGGGVVQGEGTVSRSWPTGSPNFGAVGTAPSQDLVGGTYLLETDLVNVNRYKIDAGKEYEIRISAENPARFAVYDLVKIICSLGVHDTIETEEQELLFARVPEIARCASRRNRSHSWLATKWRYIDRVIAFCAAFRGKAHATEVDKFRSTSAFMLIEKLVTAIQQQGPDHPVAQALQSQTDASQGESGANGSGTVASLPGEAEFRQDLKRMCRDRTLVGQRLSVYWGGDKSWYSGKVLECRKGREFKIVYDDGEISWESVSMQIGVRFLDPAAKRMIAAARAAEKEARTSEPAVEEIQEWRVLNFINSEPYEPSDIRLTGEEPPRIALRDFLECVLDVETGSETKQKQVVKQLRRNLKKNVVQEYIFVDEKGQEDQTEVVALTELGKIFPLLPSNFTNRVRETGDLHRLQKMLRQETGISEIEMSVEAPGPGPILQGLDASRGGRKAGKAGKAVAHVNVADWQEMWSPVLCLPSDDTSARVATAARNSDPYVDPAPASLRLESRQLMTQASGHTSLPGATSRHPGHIRLPAAPTAELRWLCTTGNLTGRRVSVYWPKDDTWYDGTVDQCQPGRFKLTYDSNSTKAAANAEPAEPVVRWEVLGIGVHLLTQLPVGETMRKMFATRSRMVIGRGRPDTAPRLKHRQSAAALNTMEREADPTALAMLMAPSFRVEGRPRSLPVSGNGAAVNTKRNRDATDDRAGETSGWTPKEEALLRQVVISMGTGRWEAKAAAMKTKRSWMALALRYGSMIRRQKNDPLLKRGFRLFSASPSTQELKAARSALGIAEPQLSCEACGISIDGSYGSGRFCSMSCKNKRSNTVKHVSTGAVRTKKQCEACGIITDGSYGSGRFCSQSCKNRHSNTVKHMSTGAVRTKKQCEACGISTDGSYGSGRFCSQSCKNRHSNTVKHMSTGAVRTKKQCESCGISTDGSYGSGRFCSQSCKNRQSNATKHVSTGAVRTKKQCESCGISTDGSYGSGRFCSQSCKNRQSNATKHVSTGAVRTKKQCESCGISTDGSYGSGRFCSQSCKNRRSNATKHVSTGAVRTKPNKRFRASDASDESDESEHERRQCEQCGQVLSPPLFGSGRFCGQVCGARFSKSVRDKADAESSRGSSSPSEDEEDEDSEGHKTKVGEHAKNYSHGSKPSPGADGRLPKRQRIAPKPFVAGPASRFG